MTSPTPSNELVGQLHEQAEICNREGWPEPLYTKAAETILRLEAEIAELRHDLERVMKRENDFLNALEKSAHNPSPSSRESGE